MNRLDINKIRQFFSTQPIVKAWLFGSYARGEETSESDVDILVSFDNTAKVGLLKHADIMIKLEEILQKPVDLVSESSLLEWVRPHVDTDKILIYERRG